MSEYIDSFIFIFWLIGIYKYNKFKLEEINSLNVNSFESVDLYLKKLKTYY